MQLFTRKRGSRQTSNTTAQRTRRRTGIAGFPGWSRGKSEPQLADLIRPNQRGSFLRKSRLVALTAVASVSALIATGLAHADKLESDTNGDELFTETPHDDNVLAMGQVCATTGTDGYNGGNGQPVDLYLVRSQSGANVWGNNVAVELTKTDPTQTAIKVTLPTPSSITTPNDWTTLPGDSKAGAATAMVRVESEDVGALTGSGTARKITFTASGDNSQSPAITLERTKAVEISATIVNDAVATLVDCKLPTVDITVPAANAEYVLNSSHAADYSCDDPEGAVSGASGIKSSGGCVGTVADSADIDTGTTGEKSFTVVATDNAGNTTSSTVNYTVIEASEPSAAVTFDGFFQPVDAYNVVKAGQGVALKWLTNSDGTAVEDDAAGHSVTSSRFTEDCQGLGGEDTQPPADTSGQSGLRWDADANQYVFVWKTSKSWADTCRTFTVTYGGESLSANFYFKR
jgi:hypothetical protein